MEECGREIGRNKVNFALCTMKLYGIGIPFGRLFAFRVLITLNVNERFCCCVLGIWHRPRIYVHQSRDHPMSKLDQNELLGSEGLKCIQNARKETDSQLTLYLNTETMHKSLAIAMAGPSTTSNPRLHRKLSIQQPTA